MAEFGRYILSVSSAAVIVCVCCSFFIEKSAAGRLIRMIGGLLLTFVMLSPVAKWDYGAITTCIQTVEIDGESSAKQGMKLSRNAVADIIKETTESYILDKAGDLRTDLSVEVQLDDRGIPAPAFVKIRGNVAPHVKSNLIQMIAQDLGIPKENQIWIG